MLPVVLCPEELCLDCSEGEELGNPPPLHHVINLLEGFRYVFTHCVPEECFDFLVLFRRRGSAAIVLIVMGSGTVKGFAVNLALGIVVSMFTAIVVTRSLLTWFINTGLITNPWFYGLNRKPPEHMLKKGGQK